MNKSFLILALVLLGFPTLKAQVEYSPVTTSTPFLMIVPDSRGGAMGDIGVATSPDANSIFYNPAKLAFASHQFNVGINYVPWLRNITNDVFVSNLMLTNRLDEKSAWGVNLKYFSYGKIDTNNGEFDPSGDLISTGIEKPYEMAISGAYALKLSENFSMGVGMRYIHSDIAIRVDDSPIKKVNTVSVDVSGYFQSDEKNFGEFNGRYRGGFNISNIGPKVSLYDGGEDSFIPTNLRLGGGFDFILDDMNTITANVEFNKLLVPTPPIRDRKDLDGDGDRDEILEGKDDNVGFISGMFQSFGDAPGGFSEELKEFTWAVGTEYMYDHTLAIRAGYFNEHDLKGARKYFTLGAGFKFKNSTIDFSYLINSSAINNPLDNTLRFSLSLDFGDIYEDF